MKFQWEFMMFIFFQNVFYFHFFLKINLKFVNVSYIHYIYLFIRFVLDKSVTIEAIADLLVDDMTGADLYSICSNAWLSAVRRTITNHQNG